MQFFIIKVDYESVILISKFFKKCFPLGPFLTGISQVQKNHSRISYPKTYYVYMTFYRNTDQLRSFLSSPPVECYIVTPKDIILIN